MRMDSTYFRDRPTFAFDFSGGSVLPSE